MKLSLATLLTLLLVCLFSTTTNSVELKMALVIDGQFNDLGYNFMVNTARIEIEYALNVTSLLVEEIDNNVTALTVFENLVQLGYNFIISGSFEHGTAASIMAEKYPNIFWVDKGRRRPNFPNMARTAFNGADARYLCGFYAGLMTNVSKVGFVVPGPPTDFNYTMNAFYLGAKHSCPNCEVYEMRTGKYYDPVLAVGAAERLLEEGCDVIGQIQDDASVTEFAIEHGMLGIGFTGYPLSNLYGASLGMGIVTDWTPTFLPLAASIINDSWIPYNVLQGNIRNYQSKLDRISPAVPASVETLLLAERDRIINEGLFFLCGPLVDEIARANSSLDCVTEMEFYQSLGLSGIIDLGLYEIPIVETRLPAGIRVTFIIISGITMILVAFTISLVAIFRKAAILMSSSVVFTEIMSVGSLLVYSAVILWVLTPTDSVCSARIWLASLGYTAMIGSMLIKNIRIWLIFDKTKFKKRSIHDWKLGLGLLGLLIFHIILLAIWDHYAANHSAFAQAIDNVGPYNYIIVCETEPTGDRILYAILLIHGISLVFGCFLSYKLRDVSLEDFNESKTIAMILNSLALCLFIAIPLLVVPQTVFNRVIIIDACMYFTTTASLVIFFTPKVINMLSKGLRRKAFSTGASKDTTELDTTRSSKDAMELPE